MGRQSQLADDRQQQRAVTVDHDMEMPGHTRLEGNILQQVQNIGPGYIPVGNSLLRVSLLAALALDELEGAFPHYSCFHFIIFSKL